MTILYGIAIAFCALASITAGLVLWACLVVASDYDDDMGAG